MMKRFFALFFVIVVALSLSACNDKKIRNPYVGEYIIGQSNIKGTVDINYYSKISPAFEIGASQEGEAVFKNPDEAFEKIEGIVC